MRLLRWFVCMAYGQHLLEPIMFRDTPIAMRCTRCESKFPLFGGRL